MSRREGLLRAIGLGASFLALAGAASVAAHASPAVILMGVAVGALSMVAMVGLGWALPGERPRSRNRGIAFGAALGAGLAVGASSILTVVYPEGPKYLAVGGLAWISGFFLVLVPYIVRRNTD